MTVSITRAVCRALAAALIGGGIVLAAANPVSASVTTADTAVTTVSEQGDRLRGPWIMTNDDLQATSPTSPWRSVSLFLYADNYYEGWDRDRYIQWASIASFPAAGTTGPVMFGDRCVTQTGATEPYAVALRACDVGAVAQQFVTNADGTISYPQVPGTYLQFETSPFPDRGPYMIISSEDGAYLERFDFTTLVPVASTDCAEGLTGWVEDLDQATRSVVLSGTAAPGATITVTPPRIHVPASGEWTVATTVVDTNGDWTVTITDLWEGYNAFTINSSDNCTPFDGLGVDIGPLAVPIMPPAAAGGTAILTLGILGLVLRRRTTACN